MTSTALAITSIDNEPRVLDTDIAQQLGMANVYDIRTLIRSHIEELEGFGNISAVTRNTGGRGRPATAYYLNKDQALLICILSRTEIAKQVRAEVIRRFTAYEELVAVVTPRLPGNYLEALKALTAEVEGREAAQAQVKVLEPLATVGRLACEHRHTLIRFVRTLPGVNTMKAKSDLYRDGYFYRQGGTYRVYAKHQTLFTERLSDEYGSVDIFPTEKGKVLLAQLYKSGRLTMRKGASIIEH